MRGWLNVSHAHVTRPRLSIQSHNLVCNTTVYCLLTDFGPHCLRASEKWPPSTFKWQGLPVLYNVI
jgi:hypothetical protein